MKWIYLCGKQGDIHFFRDKKAGSCRILAVHSESYPQPVGLWIYIPFGIIEIKNSPQKTWNPQKICIIYSFLRQENNAVKSNM